MRKIPPKYPSLSVIYYCKMLFLIYGTRTLICICIYGTRTIWWLNHQQQHLPVINLKIMFEISEHLESIFNPEISLFWKEETVVASENIEQSSSACFWFCDSSHCAWCKYLLPLPVPLPIKMQCFGPLLTTRRLSSPHHSTKNARHSLIHFLHYFQVQNGLGNRFWYLPSNKSFWSATFSTLSFLNPQHTKHLKHLNLPIINIKNWLPNPLILKKVYK